MTYSDDILQLIKTENYPVELSFFAQPQIDKFRLYPSIEISNKSPQGLDEKVDVIKETNKFEITLYYKYNRSLNVETGIISDIESIILSKLDISNLADKKIIIESKSWNRSDLEIHGIKSTLFVSIVETVSTTGSGVLGNNITMNLPNLSLNVLSLPDFSESIAFDGIVDDSGNRNVIGTTQNGSIFVEYESNKSNQDSIRNLISNREKIPCNISASDGVINFSGVLVGNKISAQYDGIKRAVLHIEF